MKLRLHALADVRHLVDVRILVQQLLGNSQVGVGALLGNALYNGTHTSGNALLHSWTQAGKPVSATYVQRRPPVCVHDVNRRSHTQQVLHHLDLPASGRQVKWCLQVGTLPRIHIRTTRHQRPVRVNHNSMPSEPTPTR